MKKLFCSFLFLTNIFFLAPLHVVAETYTMGILPLVCYSEYRVAEVKGFWAKYGVDVQLIEYSVVSEIKRSGVQRRFDFVSLPLSTVAQYWIEGADGIYLGTFSIADRHKAILVKKNLNKQSLKGLNVGTFLLDTSSSFFLSAYLKTVDTRLDEIRLVEMSSDNLEANFRRNRLQVVVDVNRGYTAYTQSNGRIALSTTKFYEPHGLLLLRKGGLASVPAEDLLNILRGTVEAVAWIHNPANWDEYKAILKQYVFPGLPDLPDNVYRELAQDTRFPSPSELLNQNQELLSAYFTEFRTFLDAEHLFNGDMSDEFTYERVVQNQALIDLLQDVVESEK